MTVRLPWLAHTLCTAIYLNLLWIAGAMPVVTLPAASGALLAMVHRWQRTGAAPSAQAFLAAMRACFWRSLAAGGVVAAVVALTWFNVAIANQFGSGRRVFLALMFAVLLNGLVLTVFALPFLASQGGNLHTCVKTAAQLAAHSPAAAATAALTVAGAATVTAAFPITLLALPVAVAAVVESLRHRATKRLLHGVPVS